MNRDSLTPAPAPKLTREDVDLYRLQKAMNGKRIVIEPAPQAGPGSKGEEDAFAEWWPTVNQTIGEVAARKAWMARAALSAPSQAVAQEHPTAPAQGGDEEWRTMLVKACAELIRRTGNIENQHCRYWYRSLGMARAPGAAPTTEKGGEG